MNLKFDLRRLEEAYRLLFAFIEVMPRIPRGHRELLERHAPEVQLVRCLGEDTLGHFDATDETIRLAWAAFPFLDDAALQGLLAHELAHVVRQLLGIRSRDPCEEEQETNALMCSWRLRREREALDAAKQREELWESLHEAAAE